MTPARWQHVREIVYGASQVEATQRRFYVAEQCGNDALLRAEVEDLLTALGESGDFLESPVFRVRIPQNPLAERPTDLSEEPADAPFPNQTGRRVGVYELLEEIGRGGMGEVYRAVRVDGQFEKEVAIKLVRRGYDGAFLLERFRNERQVLARLEHPNIARLLDGGSTDDGIPYLAMELIEGMPIDQYCAQHDLNVDARLKLFNEVCAAVQYAHQRLVIHRDIKPGNILVTAEGVPKLLDFGIAKLVDPADGSDATLLLPMTPEYASPEQIRGELMTTASDIYSLGVVLYVLLTDRFPYRVNRRNIAEMARATTETEPERPSDALLRVEDDGGTAPRAARDTSDAKRRRLRGDLDVIVLKALRKEPQLRYSSVEQFSEDIRREMQRLPVAARRGSWNYRAGKFVRRHKIAMAVVMLAAAGIAGGTFAIVRESRIASANARRAEKRFNDVRALATSNLFELNDAIEKLPASAQARHLLIQRALEYLDRLRNENGGDRDLMRQIAVGYERIAELQGRFTGTGVGDVNNSIDSYRNALAIRSRLVEMSHQDPDEVKAQLRVQGAYARSLLLSGQLQKCLESAQSGLALSRELLKNRPHDPEARIAYANANLTLAWALGGNGSSPNTRELDEAIALDRNTIDALAQLNPQDPKTRQRLAATQMILAEHYWKKRDLSKSLEVLNGTLSRETAQSVGPVLILRIYNWRGHIFVNLGDHRRALRDYRQGLLLAQSVAKADPRDLEARLDVDILTGLSSIEEARLGERRASLQRLNEVLRSIEEMFAANPESFYQRILLVGYSFRGEILSARGDQEGGRSDFARCLAIAEDLAKTDPIDLDSRLQAARAHAGLGILWARSADFGRARTELSTSAEVLKQLLAKRPGDAAARDLAGTTQEELSALDGCSAQRPCPSVKQFALPSLIE